MAIFGNRIIRDTDGAVLVEVTVMMTITFVFILGAIDFLFAFYQWNMAAKAAEVGARIATVSAPVTNGFNSLSAAVVAGSVQAGDPMPTFTVTCSGNVADGSSGSCTCSGTCTGVSGYNAAAMQTIVFGRSTNNTAKTACGIPSSFYYAGMCNMFDRITPQNVLITYRQTGLGYAGRPGGPVPTITVQLQSIPFKYFFLGGLLGFADINIPPVTTTITGEDICSSASC